MTNGSRPPGFPGDIPVSQQQFENWAMDIEVPNVWTCVPQSEDDVVRVCNWAAGAGYSVRASGIRHTWSPITVVNGEPPRVMLVDMTQKLNAVVSISAANGGQPAQVKVQCGATMDALLGALEQAPGGKGAASGFGFAHTPAPGNITVGGALAINAHGTAVPTPPNDDFNVPYGSLSNQILAFTAVVTADPNSPQTYSAQTFRRGEGDDRAFLTHVGRAFLLNVTLQVCDNYNLRCQSLVNIPNTKLFAQPSGPTPPPDSVADFLNRSGRLEVIWFPTFPILGVTLPSYPWLKIWTVDAQKPESSRAVTSPYNYPFSDNLPSEVTTLLKQVVSGAAAVTPAFCWAFSQFTNSALTGGWGFQDATDLWGPSKNTLLYVKDTTLRVTANGYAVLMKRADVQKAVADFASQFLSMLAQYQNQNLYPINSPLEIRITGLDDPSKIVASAGPARSPVISSLSVDPVVQQNGWDVAAWFDVLTVIPPGDPQKAFQFYAQLEAWFASRFGSAVRMMPEWSKGWAYTADKGPWTNAAMIEAFKAQFTNGRAADDTWAWEVATLERYDASNLYSNPFLDQLFTDAALTPKLTIKGQSDPGAPFAHRDSGTVRPTA